MQVRMMVLVLGNFCNPVKEIDPGHEVLDPPFSPYRLPIVREAPGGHTLGQLLSLGKREGRDSAFAGNAVLSY
jgi:hypothetical protein